MRAATLLASTASLALSASALNILPRGTLLWDGRFNELSSSTDLNKWSWSNQVPPYQYYIHGSSAVTSYINLSPSYANPADTSSKQGAKFTLDSTAYWNGQNMRRIELIPQTSAPINQGKVFYHLSIKRSAVNPPSLSREHQIAFFESHFTELKAGWISGEAGTTDPLLRWMVGGQTKWSANWDADAWHNFAYEIDFSAGTVGLWHSTGGADLVQVVAPVPASTSSNGADFHVGVLELPRDGYPDAVEDIYFSGVYIEGGSVTTKIGSGQGSTSPPPPSSAVPGSTSRVSTASRTSTPAVSVTSTSTTTKAPSATLSSPVISGQTPYGQCGGSGWAGPTSCASGKCSTLNPYYAQCL